MKRICKEKEYTSIIANRLKCTEPHPIELGFISVKPDLICDGIAYEIECEDKVHYGVGQALAYQYGGYRAGLIVIVNGRDNDRLDQLINFLRWVSNRLGIEPLIFRCMDYECDFIRVK